MAYESMAPPSLDMGDFFEGRHIRPLPKRKRMPLDFADLTEDFYEDLRQSLPVDGSFMESLPSFMNAANIDPTSAEAYFPLIHSIQPEPVQPPEDPISTARMQSPTVNGIEEEEDRGDGDYVDHLQNPANSKKRKIPGARRPEHFSPESDGAIDHGGGAAAAENASGHGGSVQREMSTVRTVHVSRTALAGERVREKLRARRRQLENVIPAGSDKLAVDLALTQLNVPSAPTPLGGAYVTKGRSLKRKAGMTTPTRKPLADRTIHEADNGFLSQEFTFECRSPSSARYITVNEDMHMLQATFEDEISRQAAKAAEEASKLAAIVANHHTDESKSNNDLKGRKRPSANQAPLSSASPEVTGMSKHKGSKKKKRSAIANASNPHHFRNYVPSRLPYTSHPSGAAVNAASLNLAFGPLPVEFLTSLLPPRSGKSTDVAHDTAAGVPPADEWICPFCDYDVFYGDDAKFRRAIRKRKRILRRRRRARERAAAAAGTTAVAPSADSQSGGYVEDDEAISNEAGRSDVGLPGGGGAARGKREGAG